MRSKFPIEEQMTDDAIENEIRYCDTLNRVLPPDIRCIAWKPLYNREFSSRFDCRERVYRYIFPRSNLNLNAMQEACKYLEGIHDFRNLCKMDVQNGVVTFVRELCSVRIVEANHKLVESGPLDMFYVELIGMTFYSIFSNQAIGFSSLHLQTLLFSFYIGKAFLWHQVRAIMAILLLVGQENEKPEIIRELLDVENNPCTPQYRYTSHRYKL